MTVERLTMSDEMPLCLPTRFDLCGLATCFGASDRDGGSEAAEPVWVCDIAVPLGPHGNAVDRIARAEGAAKLDDNLTTCPLPKAGTGMPSRYANGTIQRELGNWGLKRYLGNDLAVDMVARRTLNARLSRCDVYFWPVADFPRHPRQRPQVTRS